MDIFLQYFQYDFLAGLKSNRFTNSLRYESFLSLDEQKELSILTVIKTNCRLNDSRLV